MLQDFFKAAAYLKSGTQMSLQPGLRPYLIVPVIANILLFSSMGYLVFSHIGGWINWLHINSDLPGISWINGLLHALAWLVIGGVMILFTAYTFTFITQFLISPFLGIFAEQVERRLHETRYPQHKISQIAWRTLKREVRKFIYWSVRAVGLVVVTFILSFIPGINLINPILWALFAAWVLALQYIDIAADNNGLPFQATLDIMRKKRALVLGFGGIALALTIIPIINWFIIPIAVASAVTLWVNEHPA